MDTEELNSDKLANEKLLLEIQELKNKIADSKRTKSWEIYIKPLVTVFVTVLITVFGWILSGKFNNSQLKITEAKNKSDKEIAQINASLTYIKLMTDISDSSIQLKRQAKSVIAPALPPETSFYLAVDDLPKDPFFLSFLISTHPKEYLKYLMPYLETYPLFFKNDPFRKPIDDLPLFTYLESRDLLKSFYQTITIDTFNSRFRTYALINYFDFLYAKEELDRNPSMNNKIKTQIFSTIEGSKNLKLKADLSKAASIVLDRWHTQYDYTILAARYFWVGFDLSIGETFKENSMERFIYANRFHETSPIDKNELPVIDSLSKSLFVGLNQLNFSNMDIDRITVILYSYCESVNNDAKTPFSSYLKPEHSVQIIQKIISSLNTEQKKQEFSMHLGSLSGDILFRNITQDKKSGKALSELLISWYSQNWRKDWYIPKFFHSVINEFPEYKAKIDKKWGIGIE